MDSRIHDRHSGDAGGRGGGEKRIDVAGHMARLTGDW